ncbi:MAG: right-handed parallel beta-helix repeat-containing protein, partial [Gammaproteobacteria bacterium]
QPLAELDAVPWEALNAGDVVAIHARPAPYRGKFVLARSGTAAQPIVVRGVADAAGALPVIDGDGATTRHALDYWNENRAVIKVGGASIPAGPAQHIVIEALVVRGAHPSHGFTDDNGNPASYSTNAAAIFIEDGAFITVRRCELTASGNGLFVANLSSDITVEESYLHGNGNVGSIFEHNSYTEARGMHYRFNRFGPLRAGAGGNNLKDRSAGLVVAYNWIEDGNRQLDLVDSATFAATAPTAYATTFVYGNVLIEHDGEGNRQLVHYGGDSGNTAAYRKGTLHFYHNTVVSERSGRTTLFRLATDDERADIRGNIFFNAGDPQTLELATSAGHYAFRDNWLRASYVTSFDAAFSGVVTHTNSLSGDDPGFSDRLAQDYRPHPEAAVVAAGSALAAAVLPLHDVTHEYVTPGRPAARRQRPARPRRAAACGRRSRRGHPRTVRRPSCPVPAGAGPGLGSTTVRGRGQAWRRRGLNTWGRCRAACAGTTGFSHEEDTPGDDVAPLQARHPAMRFSTSRARPARVAPIRREDQCRDRSEERR